MGNEWNESLKWSGRNEELEKRVVESLSSLAAQPRKEGTFMHCSACIYIAPNLTETWIRRFTISCCRRKSYKSLYCYRRWRVCCGGLTTWQHTHSKRYRIPWSELRGNLNVFKTVYQIILFTQRQIRIFKDFYLGTFHFAKFSYSKLRKELQFDWSISLRQPCVV